MFGYSGLEFHKYKAWNEVLLTHNVPFEFIGYTKKQVAVRLLPILDSIKSDKISQLYEKDLNYYAVYVNEWLPDQ